MTRKRTDAPPPTEEVFPPLKNDGQGQPLSLKERRQATHGRRSERQRRSERTQLEEIHELSIDEAVEKLGQPFDTPESTTTPTPTPAPQKPYTQPPVPKLGNPTSPGIKAPPIPIVKVDARVDVLEQNTDTATRLLTYEGVVKAADAIDAVEPAGVLDLIEEVDPVDAADAADTAVDVRMDADFLEQLKSIQSNARTASAQPTAEDTLQDRSPSSPANIWTSDFGSSQENLGGQELLPLPVESESLEDLDAFGALDIIEDYEEMDSVELVALDHPLTEYPPASTQGESASYHASYPAPDHTRHTPSKGLRPLSLRDSVVGEGAGSTMDIKAPKSGEQDPTQPGPAISQERQLLIELAINNRKVLRNFQVQERHVYLHFDDLGNLALADSPQATASDLFAFPSFDRERLISVSVPIGFVHDDMGALCESHLVLAKARKDEPIWSLAIADLQATSAKTLQFKKWLSASEEDLAHLNKDQQVQLAMMLDDGHFDRVLRNEERPQSVSPERARNRSTGNLPTLTDSDIIDTNPKAQKSPAPTPPKPRPARKASEPYVPRHKRKNVERIPSKIMHPASMQVIVGEEPGPTNPLATAHPDRRPGQPAQATTSRPELFDDPLQVSQPEIRQHTLSHSNLIPMVSTTTVSRDDTAMRRIRVDSATLDPKALQLHVKIPRKFAGKWFKGTEETLSIYGKHRELRLQSLGIMIQFTFSQSPQGKIFPQVALTRSANVKDIPFAQHVLEIFANRNPQAENGWDHIQQLARGHMAQIDLSPTDQIRGVLEMYVHHSENGLVAEPIQMSWSVEE